MLYNEFIDFLKKFYGDKPPKNVTEYSNHYPKGFSRTAVRAKFNKTISQILLDINDSYVKTNDESRSINAILNDCGLKELEWLNPEEYTNGKANNLLFKCKICGGTFTTSYNSLRLTKRGCSHCAGNSPLVKETVLAKLYSVIEDNKCLFQYSTLDKHTHINRELLSKSKIQVICTVCGTSFEKEVSNMYYRQVCRCPVCFPSKVYPVHYEDITFNSKFELECYKILKNAGIPIEIHVKYSEILNTIKRYSCDFFIRKSNTIIEVTSYSEGSDFYSSHRETLEKKKALAVTNNFTFHVVRSLPELEALVILLKDIV